MNIRFISQLNSKKIFDYSCSAGFNGVAIAPDGNLFPCHFFMGEKQYCIGKYENGEYTFNEYMESKNKFAEILRCNQVECQNCWNRALCSICPAYILINGKGTIPLSTCISERESSEKNILLYAKLKQNPVLWQSFTEEIRDLCSAN